MAANLSSTYPASDGLRSCTFSETSGVNELALFWFNGEDTQQLWWLNKDGVGYRQSFYQEADQLTPRTLQAQVVLLQVGMQGHCHDHGGRNRWPAQRRGFTTSAPGGCFRSTRLLDVRWRDSEHVCNGQVSQGWGRASVCGLKILPCLPVFTEPLLYLCFDNNTVSA